jgi:hypothetical protein
MYSRVDEVAHDEIILAGKLADGVAVHFVDFGEEWQRLREVASGAVEQIEEDLCA